MRHSTRERPGLGRSLARSDLREGAHMEIGVIGAGNVGGTLGRRWAQAGHAVVFGVREPHEEKVHTLLASAGVHARAGTVEEAATASTVVVLTVPWEARHAPLRRAGARTAKHP